MTAWKRMQRFYEPGTFTVQERRDAIADLAMLKNSPYWDRVNANTARRLAREIGITAIRPQDIPANYMANTRRCRPLTVPPPRS